MIKCKVFKTDWNSPKLHTAARAFNSFCLDNPDIEVIKIDTVATGQDNGDPQIFLYYKEPETTYSYCSGIRNPSIQKDDLIYYLHNGEEIVAKVIQCDPVNDRITISFRDGNIVNQVHIPYKNVSFVPDSIEVRNFKPGDSVIYRCNCKEYEATILRTYHSTCILSYHNHIVETNYLYIDKVEN